MLFNKAVLHGNVSLLYKATQRAMIGVFVKDKIRNVVNGRAHGIKLKWQWTAEELITARENGLLGGET